jgi:hypothetical protein
MASVSAFVIHLTNILLVVPYLLKWGLFLYFCLYLLFKKTNYMYQFIQKFHSGWAYIALLLLIIVANALIGITSKKNLQLRIVRLPFD